MKLQRLEIKRFGCFTEYDIDFTGGLQVVVGDNESGKSTIVQALCTVLFDDSTCVAKGQRRYQYQSWESEHPFILHLVYQDGGRTYHLTRDVATETNLLEEVETGHRWSTFKEVQTQIAKALGFSEKQFYVATSLIRQGDLAGISRATDLIKDKLEAMLSSNREEILASQLSERLVTRLAQILGTESAHPGELAALERKNEDWKIELGIVATKTEDLLKARARQAEIGGEIAVARRHFEEKHDLFKKSKLAFEAEQSLDKEREIYLELNRRTKDASELKNQIIDKKEALKSMLKVERADVKSTEALAIQNQLNQARMENAVARAEKEEEAVAAAKPRTWYKGLTGSSLLATLVGLFLWSKLHDSLYLGVAVALLVVAVVAVMLWMSGWQTYRRTLTKKAEAQSRWKEEQENFQKCNETLQALLRRFSVKTVDELAELYEQYRDLDRDLKALSARYETLLGDNKLRDMEADLEKMTARMKKEQETFDKYRAYAVSAAQLEQLQKEVAELDKKLRQLEEEATSVRNKLQYTEAGSDIMAPLRERIADGEKQLHRLRQEGEVLAIIARYLEEARRRVLKSSIETLEEEASTLFGSLTGGKWRQVRLDRQTLACEVSTDGENWAQAATALSSGALDSLHLAMRLALVKVISVETQPPIIVEDPMLSLDQNRRESTMTVLKELSRTFQVLFFTADQRLTEMADQVIELTSVRTAVPALQLE